MVRRMLAIILRIVLDPRIASYIGAALAGVPQHGHRLEAICIREAPHCQIRGIHQGDRWMERRLGKGQSTRGAWGTVAAYTTRHLPAGLRDPRWLDVPLLGAYAAARRMASRQCRRTPACMSWSGLGRTR